MKKIALLLSMSLFCSLAAAENATKGNVNVFLGNKQTLDSSWAPFDDHGELGIMIDVQPQGWPVSLTFDLMVSAHAVDYGGPIETVSTTELDFGARKVFDLQGSAFHPYIGGGLGIISARHEVEWGSLSVSDEDSSLGVWLGGGFFVTLGEHFNIGLDLRHSDADVTLWGNKEQAGGDHAGLLLGYHW